MIQEGRPFDKSTSRLCTSVPRSLLSAGVHQTRWGLPAAGHASNNCFMFANRSIHHRGTTEFLITRRSTRNVDTSATIRIYLDDLRGHHVRDLSHRYRYRFSSSTDLLRFTICCFVPRFLNYLAYKIFHLVRTELKSSEKAVSGENLVSNIY